MFKLAEYLPLPWTELIKSLFGFQGAVFVEILGKACFLVLEALYSLIEAYFRISNIEMRYIQVYVSGLDGKDAQGLNESNSHSPVNQN